MLNYKDDQCSYVNYLFHESLKEELKDGGEADKLIEHWEEWNKNPAFDLPKVTKEEVENVKQLKALEYAKSGDVPFAALIPTLLRCPHTMLSLLTIMQSNCKYLINVKTLQLIKKED